MWGFYGRTREQDALRRVLDRRRWFFAKVTGRRRIGKTSLIQRALAASGRERVFYCQIPDSGPAGVLSAIEDAMETFRLGQEGLVVPRTLNELATLVTQLARRGFVVALDEFQYFNRERLSGFASFLQREVDVLAADAAAVPGGLIVLGSIHTEMAAILDDRRAPLYNRVTDELELQHLDVASIRDLLQAHEAYAPERLLFLWNLFEGVPKFYRDCYEQGVLASDRRELLTRAFFQSSSPLRTEADNWFLKELHGRYDSVLKIVARRPGCSHGDIVAAVRETSPGSKEQAGGYLKVLVERYRMIERRLPVFERKVAKKGRYYLADNFLRSWLSALSGAVAAANFRPVEQLVADADLRLVECEGHALERLVGRLYEERSRKGIGDFPITERIEGFWDSRDTEIDLVALNATDRRVRLGTCKRSADRLPRNRTVFEGHVHRFLESRPELTGWSIEKISFAPVVSRDIRLELEAAGHRVQDLADLVAELP